MSRILIVMSAADVWERTDGSAYPTGYWAEEVAAPHEKDWQTAQRLLVDLDAGRS